MIHVLWHYDFWKAIEFSFYINNSSVISMIYIYIYIQFGRTPAASVMMLDVRTLA